MQLPYAEGLNLLIVALPDSGSETADKLWIRQVSSVGGNFMGYQPDELLSKPLTLICPERIADVWNAAWRSWRLGGGATHTIWCRDCEGKLKPWEATFSLLTGAEAAVLLQDYESRKQEPPLWPSKVADEDEPVAEPNAIVTIGGDRRVIEWNAQAEALFAWSRLDALGQPFPDFLITAEILQNHSEICEQPVEDQQQSPNAVVTIGENKKVIEWNDQSEALFGWSRPDALGQPFPDFLMPQATQQIPGSELKADLDEDDQKPLPQADAIAADQHADAEIIEDLANVPVGLADEERLSGFIPSVAAHDNDTGIKQDPVAVPATPATPVMPSIADQNQASIVTQIQQSMLPTEAISNRDFEVCAYSAARSLPGGTFLDYFSRRAGVLYMAIMDTAEHSQEAALRMLEIRSVLRAHGNSAAHALSVLDEFLSDSLTAKGFSISITYLEYNAHKQQISYANAGHLPGLLCRRTKATCQQLSADGSVIGASQKVVYEENNQHINSGDSIVLYSETLLALKNPQGETFGLERLSAVVNQFCKNSAQQILEQIIAELKHFSGQNELSGDIAALVFKRK